MYSLDGKYVMAGNYVSGGTVLLDAMTLKPLKVYPTSSVIDMDGNIGSSRVYYHFRGLKGSFKLSMEAIKHSDCIGIFTLKTQRLIAPSHMQ